MQYNPAVQTKHDHIFRYGQFFTKEQLRINSRRNPYANFLTYGIVDEIFDKGVEPIIEGQNAKYAVEILNSVANEHLASIKKACVYDRIYGKALITLTENNGEFFFRAFPPDKYEIDYDAFGRITRVVTHTNTAIEVLTDEFTGEQLQWIYEIISTPSEKIGEGISVLEPIWDELYSLSLLNANATYFVVRIGGGLKVLRVTEKDLRNDSAMSGLMRTLHEMDSASSTITLPIVEGQTEQASLEVLTGDQIDFLSIRDLVLGAVSVATGIPREAFLGNEIGMRSSEVNQEQYFSILQNIQDNYLPVLTWFFDTLIKVYKLNVKYSAVKFGSHAELSDSDNIALMGNKIDFVSKALKYLSVQQIEQIVGFSLDNIMSTDMSNIDTSNTQQGGNTQ